MKQTRQPKYKLSTMRIFWGIVSLLNIPLALFNFGFGKTTSAFIELLLVILFGWWAINPPARIRKNYIQ